MTRQFRPTATFAAIFAAALILPVCGIAASEESSPWKTVEGDSFGFTEVADGVYHVQGLEGTMAGSHGALVVGQRDSLLVDSHMTPAAARALLEDLPRVMDHPIRYLVNTHFHFDHTHGNEVFGPDIEIVAHEATRERIASGGSKRGRGYEYFIGTLPDRIAEAEAALAEAGPEERDDIEARLASMRALWQESEAAAPTAPTLTLRKAVTLYRGDREIRLHHFGQGHTGGDVVAYLPAEKVLVSGDLVTEGLPYMGDAHFPEWIETLGALEELEVEVILPGHGGPLAGSARIGELRGYLRDFWSRVRELHAAGVPAEEAARTIDMTDHREHYPQIEGPGAHPHAVARAYELLEAGGASEGSVEGD